MIAWCGSRAEGLEWLSDRCGSIDKVVFDEPISIESVAAICSQNPRRLILSVENRLDYPLAEIRLLQRSWPEVPWALAVGSWFDGSRRTGIGATNHLTLPWYRWWDGWQQWLNGSNTELLNPWPKVMLNRSFEAGGSVSQSSTSGVILCDCQQTAAGWQAGLECDPANSQLLTLRKFQSLVVQASMAAPDWILWDDSCLNTFVGADCLTEVCELFATIRQSFPAAILLAATCMPRWSDWQQWKSAGANELIAKPSQGLVLRDVLQQYAT